MNKVRGETTITLGDRSVVLRPTFEVLVEIEEITGLSAPLLLRRFAFNDVRVRDLAAIVWASAKAVDAEAAGSFVAMGEAIVRVGVAELIAPIGDFYAGSLAAGDTAAGEDAGNDNEADGDPPPEAPRT